VERERRYQDKKIKRRLQILYNYYWCNQVKKPKLCIKHKFFFFLNCDFSCKTKTMYQTEFFLQS
jgi:hypothetical protein